MLNLCDPRTIKQVMDMFGLTFKKEYGQNFLTDRSVVEDIADSCCYDENSTILEIGPGMGTLTYELALRHKSVVALEIDRGLMEVLKIILTSLRCDILAMCWAIVSRISVLFSSSPVKNTEEPYIMYFKNAIK